MHADQPSSPDACEPTEDSSGPAPENYPENPEESPFSVQLPEGGSPTAGLDSIMPVALFLLLNRFFGLGWGIIGATVWTAKSLITRARRGEPLGKFLPIVLALIVGRGIIGFVTDSERVYFGLGIAAKYGIAVGLLISVLVKKNAVARLAPYVFGFGSAIRNHRSYISATAVITVVGALYYAASATFDIWLLGSGSTERYVLVRTGVNWVASTVIMLGCTFYMARRLKEIEGFPGLMPLFEQRVELQAAAFGWDISDPDAKSDADEPDEEADGADREAIEPDVDDPDGSST